MKSECPVPMVRCHLDGGEDDPARDVRYIPAAEFELWRHFMETRHFRVVTVDEVSVWVPETPAAWEAHEDAEALLPVLRLQFEKPGPEGILVPVVRFFPAETYPEAKQALLSHFDPRCRWSVSARPGYFVPAASTRSAPETTEAVA
jgi:hypothetical protein